MEDARTHKSVADVLEILHNPAPTEDDLSRLRILFKECAELRSVPHNERNNVSPTQFCKLMVVKELNEGDVVLQDNNLTPDLFIVLTGLLSTNRRLKQSRSWGSFQAFGDLEHLTGEIWQAQRVTCLRKATVVIVNHFALESLMQRIRTAMDKAKLIEFLTTYVPGIRQIGQSSKERIGQSFELTHFKPKTLILKEREKAAYAYLINTGQCLEVSGSDLMAAQGLVSRTMAKYNFGIVTKGQWMGAESLLANQPMQFSVVTMTDVQAYRISKADFLEKLGKETLILLRDHLGQKATWRESRKSFISSTFSPYLPSSKHDPQLPSATPMVKRRIKQLQLQRENTNPAALQRPPTNVSISANQSMEHIPSEDLVVRPSSSSSALSVSFWFSHFPKKAKGLRPSTSTGERKRLAMAATLGNTMVPSVGLGFKKKLTRKHTLSTTQLKSGKVKDHFGYTPFLEQEDESLSYFEKLHKKRAPSPNPIEVLGLDGSAQVSPSARQ